jgi:NAD(P)-dependent dehydrogenase (short-subunit alcohol dehydrogenase family)
VSQDQGGLAALKWVNMIPDLYGPWLMVLVVLPFLPLLRASVHPRIVNVSSEAASLAGLGSGTPAYTASKTALNALTGCSPPNCAGSRRT